MLSNLHTHSTFTDGKNTPEEIVLWAIDNGFVSVGFSDHGYTPRDLTYCLKDTEGYRKEVLRVKEKYKNKIQVYLGIEQDASNPLNRADYEYVISSSHYCDVDGKLYPIDSNPEKFKRCLALFNGDVIKMSNNYYGIFVDHILTYKPDIIGHFDLVTKFDQMEGENRFFSNPEYNTLALNYLKKACKCGALFEVNTGAISRGYRTNPYPADYLLHEIKKQGNGVILTADSHAKETLCFAFDLAKQVLKDVGFTHHYILKDNEFIKIPL
jgi:histidinol-phosphatase (PHP family)